MIPFLLAANTRVFLLIYHVATANMLTAAVAVFLAEWFPLLLITIVVAYAFFKSNGESARHLLARFFVTPLLVLLIALAEKMLVSVPRPFVSLDIMPLISVSDPFSAFPSAHAAFFAALAVAVSAVNPRMGKWYACGALIIGIARIAVGVHWPSDVLFGLGLGFLVTSIALFLHRFSATSATHPPS